MEKVASPDTAAAVATMALKFKSGSQQSIDNRQVSYEEVSSSLINIAEDGTDCENSREEGGIGETGPLGNVSTA